MLKNKKFLKNTMNKIEIFTCNMFVMIAIDYLMNLSLAK